MKTSLEIIFGSIGPETAEGLFESINDQNISSDITKSIERKISALSGTRGKKTIRLKRIALYAAAAAVIAVISVSIPFLVKKQRPADSTPYPVQTTQDNNIKTEGTQTISSQNSTSHTISENVSNVTEATAAGTYKISTTTQSSSVPSNVSHPASEPDTSAEYVQTQTDTQAASYPTRSDPPPTSITTQAGTQHTTIQTQTDIRQTSYQIGTNTVPTDSPVDNTTVPQTTFESMPETTYEDLTTQPSDIERDTPPAISLYGTDIDTAASQGGMLADDGICAIIKQVFTSSGKYRIYGDNSQNEYFLVQFQIIDLIIGNYSGNRFYSIIPAEYYTAFTPYKTIFVYNLHQIAFDGYVLYEEATKSAVRLSLPLFGEYSEDTRTISFKGWKYIPYNNGVPDLSLWGKNDAWFNNTKEYCLYVSQKFFTISDAIKEVKSNLAWDEDVSTILMINDHTGNEAKKVLGYVSEPKNGVFVQQLHYNILASDSGYVRFTRYINGYPTDEIYGLQYQVRNHSGSGNDHINISDHVYTYEDIIRLPRLTDHFDEIRIGLERGDILPPHLEENAGIDSLKYGLTARYVKSGDTVYGLLRAGFLTEVHCRGLFIDERYYLADENGELSEITRDALLELIPDCYGVYKGEYEKNGRPVEICE